jgi:hypothetical protein
MVHDFQSNGSLGASERRGPRRPRLVGGGKTRSVAKDRSLRSPCVPPMTSTQSSPVTTFVTWATNSHLADRSPVPLTSTRSPVFRPAHAEVRCSFSGAPPRGAFAFLRRVINSCVSFTSDNGSVGERA